MFFCREAPLRVPPAPVSWGRIRPLRRPPVRGWGVARSRGGVEEGRGPAGGDAKPQVNIFWSSRVLGPWRTPSQMAPLEGEGPLTHHCDLDAGYGGAWAPNFGWVAPEFEPRTSCTRVRNRSHYTTGAAPRGKYLLSLFLRCTCGNW